MAWPPPLPPATRSNSTPQLDAHPDDHNLIADALAELVAAFGMVGRISSTLDATVSTTGGSPNRIEMGTTDYLYGGFSASDNCLVVPADGVYAVSFIVLGKSALSQPIAIAVRTGITMPPTSPTNGNIDARGTLLAVGSANTTGGCNGIVVLNAGDGVCAGALASDAGKNLSDRSLTVARIGPIN